MPLPAVEIPIESVFLATIPLEVNRPALFKNEGIERITDPESGVAIAAIDPTIKPRKKAAPVLSQLKLSL